MYQTAYQSETEESLNPQVFQEMLTSWRSTKCGQVRTTQRQGQTENLHKTLEKTLMKARVDENQPSQEDECPLLHGGPPFLSLYLEREKRLPMEELWWWSEPKTTKVTTT